MGLRLFFLTNFPGAMFIQGATVIPDSRVCVKKYLIKFLSNFSSIREKIQTPWTIRFYVAKNTSMKIFLWSKKHKFLDLAMFSKNIENF